MAPTDILAEYQEIYLKNNDFFYGDFDLWLDWLEFKSFFDEINQSKNN